MTPDEILKSYIPIVDFLAEVYGKNCEVILHDLRRLDNSIVAIRNNHITGRQVNDTITDFALKIVYNEKVLEGKHYITNYMGKTKDGKKVLRASTYFIRDEDQNLIGMLCANVDITALRKARHVIDELLMDEVVDIQDNRVQQENFTPSINEVVDTVITNTLAEYSIQPARMIMEEKKQVVADLKAQGVFLLKGGVTEVANQLEVSEQTIYRYLKELE